MGKTNYLSPEITKAVEVLRLHFEENDCGFGTVRFGPDWTDFEFVDYVYEDEFSDKKTLHTLVRYQEEYNEDGDYILKEI